MKNCVRKSIDIVCLCLYFGYVIKKKSNQNDIKFLRILFLLWIYIWLMWSKFVVSPRSCNGKFVCWIEINHLSSKQLHPSVVYGCTQFRLLQPRNLKICFNVMFLVEIQLDLFYFLCSYLASKWSNLSLSSFRVFPRSLNLISSF